ncbi:hypothetical protein DH2020_016981 [Rehmannia glutinosa]|uniref:25S rRNA (uridine-N(3))-methyltransferase BMT5-like domain-containing protein n=1 Tax=Rehmannia glutinosa TaxID=99300 RepID=A0ABR0WR79_REHGL
MLGIKHPSAAANLAFLESKGCTIMHNVDAGTMSQHVGLKHRKFDRIVFNFPHAGYTSSAEHSSYQISRHQDVVRGFLKNGYNMVTEKGEIHITHKTAYPFSRWEIEELGHKAELELIQKAEFYIWEYPGYENKRGDGNWSNSSFPVGQSTTFKFIC